MNNRSFKASLVIFAAALGCGLDTAVFAESLGKKPLSANFELKRYDGMYFLTSNASGMESEFTKLWGYNRDFL